MNKNSIDENKAIQDGLERFLDQELEVQIPPIRRDAQVRSQMPRKAEAIETPQRREQRAAYTETPQRRELKTEFATDVTRPQMQAPPTSVKDSARIQPTPVRERRSGQTRPQVRAEKKRESVAPPAGRKPSDGPSRRRAAKPKKIKKKKSKWKKVLIVLLLVVLAFFIWWYLTVGKIYREMGYEKTPGIGSEPMKSEGVTNVLLIGNDSREGGEDGRSDAMILLSISNETKTIHMTSLLRDMYVEIPGYEGNRLNAAYAYGGPSLLCETIEHNFGIEVNRYVLVNFQAFAALVDAVGGIDLEVTNEEVQWINAYLNEYNLLEGREMTTDYLDTSLFGEIHLNGPQALAYSRNRYIGTDFGRTERQRKVLSAVIKKLPVAFATNQNELIEQLFPNLTTNLTQNEVFVLSMDAGKLLSYEILQTVIPAEGTYSNASIRGMSVLEVDFEANKAIIQKEIYGKDDV